MLNTRGYAALAAGCRLTPYTFERRELGANDIAIDIKFCGICHSDIHQIRDDFGGSSFPMVPGHEIAGIVTAVGMEVTRYAPGDRVGVGSFVDSCRHCDPCQRGLEQYCSAGATWTYNAQGEDGLRTQGGYSDKIVVDENYVLSIPDNLPLDAAAPLLCAGITLYSPLRHWSVGPGKTVAIMGLGGLGHMGVKLAHALGAEVTVLSLSPGKRADAERLGANHFHVTSDPATLASLAGAFDLILNTIGGDIDLNPYLPLLKLDGSMVLVGLPLHLSQVATFSLIDARRSLAGSSLGGIAETQEMLGFCGKHGIVSDIELIAIQRVNAAFDRVLKSDVRYRFVIDMESLNAG
jgi:uncharacterized zinc-type alcohol dehydrogenase-like protein